MAQRGYLGKISAIVSINTSSVKPSLDSSAKDINAWAKSAQSRISGAANSAGRALEGIFTPLQRLQAAIKNANRNPLDLKIQNPGAYLQLAKATEQIAKPLGQVQAQFAGLANSVQAELLPVLQSAQKQTTSLFNAISSGAKVSDRDIENTTARVERLNQVIRRAGEASTLTRGLATGQELRFQQPGFVAQTRRASELQQQVASLSPAQAASRDFASIISQQRQAAIEAERLLSTLDRIRTTRNGDATEAQRAYDQQAAALGRINTQLSEQIALARASVVENQGESTNIRERLAANAQLLRAQQEEAAFRSRAADEAEREAQATARVVEQLNRAFAIERDRRSGAAARRNANAFDDSTTGVLGQAGRAADSFAREQRTIQTELARTAQLRTQFFSLPDEAQQSLETERRAINNVANAARDGAASLGVLETANNRMAAAITGASARLEEQAGVAVDVRARLAAIQAVQVAQQEEAAFRSRAADEAEREAQATARVVEQLNRAFAIERDRRSGAAARRNANAFDDSTTGVLGQANQDREVFFGTPAATVQSELQRTRELYQQFLQLSPEVQAALEQQGRGLSNVAAAANAGNASLGLLVENNDRMAASMRAANEAREGDSSPIPPGFFEDRLRRQARGILGPALDDPQRQLGGLGTSITSVKSQLDQLPLPIRTHFLPAINAAEAEFRRLNALGPRATAEDIENVTNQMRTLEAAASRAARASNFRRSFSGGSAENLNLNVQERSLAGYQAQLQLLQQTLGSVSTQARGPAVASFIALENAIATAFENGTLDSASTRRQLAALTQEAVRASAAVAGIRVGALTRQLARVGDVARGSFGNLGLAIQQGVFAFDDFFSVTGDLSQRIRAAGNNISQLGFILGGTYGLLAGVAISAGTQIAIGFGKFIGVLEDTKQREAEAKAQAEVLNSAYERQRAIVQSLADAYRDLAKGIRESTETPQNKAFNERRGRIADLRQQQQDAARERVAQAVPEIFNNRRQRALLEGQLQEQPDFAAQRRIRRQIGRLQAEEDAAFNAINENAGRLANQPRRELVRQRDELAVLRDNLARDAGRLPAGGQAQQNVAARLDDVSTRLAAFNIAIQRVTDDAVAAAVEFSGPLQDNIQKAQQRLAEAFGDTQTRAQTQLEQLGRRLEEALNSASGGQEDRRAVRARIDAIRQEAAPILGAQQELVDFAEALKSAADAARRSEQQAQDRLQEATANAEDLPGSRAAQIQQRAAAQTAAEATRRRQEIEAQTQGGRNAAAIGDTEEIRRRRQNVGTLSGGLNRFQRDAERQQERLRRGFELTSGELGNFQEKLQSDILAIEERAKQDPLNAQKILQEGRAALARENAPLFAELAANVQNALLQGPSRAALNAADVTTMEGSRELNRLLRGDDPARDVNLLELQKQTASLASVDQGIKDLANKIGVAQ